MFTYSPKKFTIPTLVGISQKSIDEHILLYEGYVKNFNAISSEITELKKDSSKNAHALSELTRRKSFEFGGMKLHEYYFPQFEGGSIALNTKNGLAEMLADSFGSVEAFIVEMRSVALMRGPGWAILYFDKTENGERLHIGFSGEQNNGHFIASPVILALDVWEHAYLLDYGVLGKAKYVDAFFANLNWNVIEDRFSNAR